MPRTRRIARVWHVSFATDAPPRVGTSYVWGGNLPDFLDIAGAPPSGVRIIRGDHQGRRMCRGTRRINRAWRVSIATDAPPRVGTSYVWGGNLPDFLDIAGAPPSGVRIIRGDHQGRRMCRGTRRINRAWRVSIATDAPPRVGTSYVWGGNLPDFQEIAGAPPSGVRIIRRDHKSRRMCRGTRRITRATPRHPATDAPPIVGTSYVGGGNWV